MPLVKLLEEIKKKTFLKKTWYIESFFVGICLVAIALISGKGWKEWIGVVAVFFTFMHASVSERLSDAESKRHVNNEPVYVECHKKLPIYFYIKEIFWLVYFVIMGAWSAIAGVIIFMLYPIWRNYYKKHKKA